MRRFLQRTRVRATSLASAAAFIVALLGLFAIDQMLAAARRAEAERSAVEGAAFLRGFLDVHVQSLQALRALYLRDVRELSDEDFSALMQVLAQHTPAFRRVYITDSAGIVRHEWTFGPNGPPLRGTDIDTLPHLQMRAIARLARRGGDTQSSRTGMLLTGERGFAILEPISRGETFLGFAGGTITAASVLDALSEITGPHILARLVLAGSDTVIADPPADARFGMLRYAQAELTAPGGGPWVLGIEYDAAQPGRIALWIVGALLLVSLSVAFVHDRRQAVRLSERTIELERLSTELLRANRVKNEFLASVSHELRTPLNAIVGFVDMLRDGVYGELAERQVNPVARVASSAAHLRQLVDQILDIAKLAAGRMEFHREPVDVRLLVSEVASEMESLLSEKNLHVQLQVPDALPRLATDRMHLRQILLNLIGNAIKYTAEGAIRIAVRTADATLAPAHLAGGEAPSAVTGEISTMPVPALWVAVDITDSGIGIAAADYERIFEEFEQVNAGSRTDSVRRGTGLGLAISRRLARLLGGDITVASEIGKGSTFTVWLPATG